MVRLCRVCVPAGAHGSPPDHQVASADATRWEDHIESSRQSCRAQGVTTQSDGMCFFAMEHHRQHGEHRLHQHTVLPRAALTQFEVGGIAFRRMESGITQDYHPCFKLPNEPLQRVIGNIGGGTRPPYDQAPLIEQQTEFAANNPTVVREAFAAHLLRAAALADRVDQNLTMSMCLCTRVLHLPLPLPREGPCDRRALPLSSSHPHGCRVDSGPPFYYCLP